MYVSEGPGSTPEISSKANPQSKVPSGFLFNPMDSNKPFGKGKQPFLNIPSGSRPHVGHKKGVDFHELHAPLPLVYRKKVTRHHHSYATKPRTSHASSSREKIKDDEDENMSPAQSETKGERRRENFMAH
ncbi:hypothetical protein O181_117349 [Austropuccinia psidii MF-1]|uniref:Uncharacterized protein n=1 Tax=Austropuccinia psidii MF-1 TaxID=1389203 RepID=A0A9Q3KAK0_9BASI|nr:hypothetical protein [Austropuccinia psidii MF-1]